ncbi:hypothetical protein ACPXCP_22710 [Streptomyces sp. DT20]|uniref:hypothetical protein n=1 Tax=unclassified Streptomyces TaxID=2593676 RepID=UPI000ADA571D|nr:hypothetical protein [Streptomyces sp. CB02488]
MTKTRLTLWAVALASFAWLGLLARDTGNNASRGMIGILFVLVVFCPVIAEVLKIRAKKRDQRSRGSQSSM